MTPSPKKTDTEDRMVAIEASAVQREKRVAANEDRLAQVETCIMNLNHEMGEVMGSLNTIKWMFGGTLLLVAADFIRNTVLP